MPAGLIEEQHRVRSRRHSLADLLQLGRHGLGVAIGQDETSTLALRRADGSEDVGRSRTLIMGGARAGSAPRPSPRYLVLLSDARLVREPDLYPVRIDARLARDPVQAGREAFLKSSMAPSAWA